jgi:molybdopterin/thiamine biosynthesis adenylyltransferase
MSLPPETIEALARTTLLVRRDIYPCLADDAIATALATTPVRLTASKRALRTRNGQTALVTSAILSAQLGVQLHLDFEEVELLAPQPPLRGEGLRESLLDLFGDLITPARVDGDGEFNIGVGTKPRGAGVALAADDWGFRLAVRGAAGSFVGDLPFGAGLGAVGASAELFRYIMVQLGKKTGARPLQEHPLRDPLPASYRLGSFDWQPNALGSVDSISAGALATAALYLLLRVPGLQMRLRFIDGDIGARSNLNRYLLLRASLLGIPKARVLATYLTDLIQIESVPHYFEDGEQEAVIEPLAKRVIVGVDDIPSRWRAQSAVPGWIGVAATSHFEVVVSEHTPDSPCAGCLHPRDDPGPAADIPTVSFVSAMSGFLLAYRLIRAGADQPNPSQTLAYPFNLAAERPVWDGPLAARSDCPVQCVAAGRVTVDAAPG